jgi:hypothetical protein
MVLILDRHFPKSRHLGFDLGIKSCLAWVDQYGGLWCGDACGQDRDVGVLDLIRHGLLECSDATVNLGDGQSRLEAQHDLDKDDAA